MHSLSQIIESPTRITSNSSSLIAHVLINSCEKNTNSGVIDLSLSDHHLIFCTKKLVGQEFNFHKQMKCISLKKYTPEKFVEENHKYALLSMYSDQNSITFVKVILHCQMYP